MSLTYSDIDSFNLFARSKIDAHAAESMSELFELFLLEHPSPECQAEIHDAIIQGLVDIEAGKGRPADEAMADLRRKHGLAAQ